MMEIDLGYRRLAVAVGKWVIRRLDAPPSGIIEMRSFEARIDAEIFICVQFRISSIDQTAPPILHRI
jgi:hypothetical protein